MTALFSLLTFCMLGNFPTFFFRNTIRVSTSLDPDQAQHNGPNCLLIFPGEKVDEI